MILRSFRDLIQTLLPAYEIDIEVQGIEISCCGANQEVPYDKVDSIWINKGDNMKVLFKYAYSNLVALLESYRISIKYVRSN